MKTFSQKKLWINSPSFALISVLALVSLAALTATAFLASARLERQATSSIGISTRLEMALNSGKVCASQVINDNSQSDVGGNTHIVTYWRTNWTDEIGYPFIGQIKTSGSAGAKVPDSAIWYYFPLFSPAGVTNLDTNVISAAMRFTNTHQGTFSNDMQTFMTQNATNGFANNPGLTNPKCVQIPLLGGRTSPPVGWVYINQEKRKFGSNLTNTSPAVRIAWFAEDLEGLIDAERMGASTLRATGTNSEEISLTNATDTNGSKIITSISTFTNARKAFISYGLLASSNVSGITNSTTARYFASGLRAWAPVNSALNNGALAWIPAGIPISGSSTFPKGYSNQGYTKLNLNKLISDTPAVAVANIAAVITNNLPGFTNRAGGMSSAAYVNNIAANIVDYVDTDSIPSTDSATSPTYIGVENIPWPNELFDEIDFVNVRYSNRQLVVEVTDRVELWNMGNKPIPASTTTNLISISNNYDLVLTFTNTFLGVGQKVNLKDMLPTLDPGTVWPRYRTYTNPVIPPNGYVVLSGRSPADNYDHASLVVTFPEAWFPSTNAAGRNLITSSWYVYPAQADATANMKYTAQYNGKVIQQSKGGRWTRYLAPSFKMGNKNMGVSPYQYIFLNPVGYASQTSLTAPGNTPAHSGGDPRAQYFLSGPLRNHNYVNSYASPGGRNVERFNIANYPESEVNPAKFWPDNGHATNSEWGGNPTQYSDGPKGYTTTAQTNNYVMTRNDTGTFTNICELGNIYDPMQWSDQSGSGVANQPGLWTNLTAAASPDARFGGRNTLRIGRPEFTRFAFTNMYGNSVPSIPNMGRSSAALLDLFCLTNGTSVSGGPYSLGGGKINLNTAPAPVLRALAGGIRLSKDLAQVPANYAIPPAMAEAFAQGVMRFRSKYPFLTPSHLSFIGTDPTWPNTNSWPINAVFGNTNTIALSTAPGNTFGSTAKMSVTEWNDQAAEEWFSKIYALSSCQSHNYRIYVVAQLVATNSLGQTNAIGPLVKKYYQIYARNGSSASRLATNSTYLNNSIYTWQPTVGVIDIYKSTY